MHNLLEIRGLSLSFSTLRGQLKALDNVSFDVTAGEALGIVGESGSGKSITSLAIMGLSPANAKLAATTMSFNGKDLRNLSKAEQRQLRGNEIAMIFQDPMSSLNPSFTIGRQLSEAIQAHERVSKAAVRARILGLLERVGIPDAAHQLQAYPHQLSGGMCQRVMIAMAIACRPKLLIADEPTTALDVTIQHQILELLRELRREEGMSLLLITHDIGVVQAMTERLVVMYAGQVVESGATKTLLSQPQHPYTAGLLACMPAHGTLGAKARLPTIPGLVPDLVRRPPACQLAPRCDYADAHCAAVVPEARLVNERLVKCHKPLTYAARG